MSKTKERAKNRLYQRMLDCGYNDVTDFARRSGISLSFETCRRAIYDNRQNIRLDYVVTLMQHLDFTVSEIKNELKARGDTFLHKLIDDSGDGVILNDQERHILARLREQPELVPVITVIVDQKDNGRKEGERKAQGQLNLV